MSSDPEMWYKRYSNSYRSFWLKFEDWIKAKGLNHEALLTKKPSETRNLIDDFLSEVAPSVATRTLKTMNAVIRSYFSYNDVIIPKSRFTFRGGKPMSIPKLTPQKIKEMVEKAKPRDASFLIFKFQSLQDNKRMLWINKNAWPQIGEQLEKGGWRDRNGNFWEGILRIDMPLERKGNIRPYFCFAGKDSIDLLNKYFEVEGKSNGVIWEGLNNENSMQSMLLRLCRREGWIPKESGDTGTRYGYNLHEFRDVSKSMWHESGADLNVWMFCAGQMVDPLGYDKIYTLSPDFAVKEFKKAEPFLSLVSYDKGQEELKKHFEEFVVRLEKIEKLMNSRKD